MKKNQKKYRFMLLIISIILIGFQNGYSEWVKEDFFKKLNVDLGEIYQFKINSANEIVVLNKANEIITINFESGEISNRCKCEIDSAASFIAMSSDGNYTIMQYYDNNLKDEYFSELKFETYFNIYNNLSCKKEKRIDRVFNIKGRDFGVKILSYANNFLDYDFNSEKIIYNIWFSLEYRTIDAMNDYSSIAFLQIYDSKSNEVKLNLGSSYESLIYDLNNFKNFYISTSSSSSQSHYGGNGTYYYNFDNTLSTFISDSNKFINLMSNGYSESRYKNEPTKFEGKYFFIKKILKHYDPDKLFLLVDTYRNNSNNKMVFYEYEISSKKLKVFEEFVSRNSTFVMDDNFKLFIFNLNVLKLYDINIGLSLIDTITFPNNIFNPIFSYSDNQTTLVYSSGNSIYKFINDKLKHNTEIELISDKQILNIDSNVTLVSKMKMKGFKFEWEVEPGVKIKTDFPVLNYSYKNAGTYDIKLKVTDNNDKDYYFIKENYITVLPNLKAEFTYKEDNGYAGTFHFENTSVGEPNNYSWYINDSLISIEKNLIYKFQLFGEFKIKLIVKNEISNDTIENTISYRKNQKADMFDSSNVVKFKFVSRGGLFSSEMTKENLILYSTDAKLSSYWAIGIITYTFSINTYNYNLSDGKLNLIEFGIGDTMQLEKFNYKNLNFKSNIVLSKSISVATLYYNYRNNLYLYSMVLDPFTYNYNYKYENNKYYIDRSHKVDDNNINTFTLEQPDSILMRNITINPKTIKTRYLTFDKNIINFETEFKENTNYLLLKYQDSSFSLNQYKFFAKNLSDVINLPKSFNLSKLSIKGDNLYILGSEPFADSRRGVIYKYNLTQNSLEKYESDTYSNFTKIKWLNDKSFVAWGSQSGSKGFVFLRNNLEVVKTNVYKNITGEINNIFLDDKKLTIVYENKEGVNYNVYVGEDEFTDDFIETLSNNVEKNEVIIYPNPTSNKIKILQQEKAFSISIFNITGLEIYSNQDIDSDTEIDLSQLPIGNYWLKINNSDKMYSLQINR